MKQPPVDLAERLWQVSDKILDLGNEVRIEELAELSGVPRATIYYYFSGRDDVMSFLLTQKVERASFIVAEAAAGPGTPSERLQKVLRAMLQQMADHPSLCTRLMCWMSASAGAEQIVIEAQGSLMNLSRPPKQLTTHDMWIPTCATCHMSGINGNKVTHDPTERLSYYLADAVSKKRPNYLYAQANMKQICLQCHTKTIPDRVYQQAEQVVESTNQRVAEAKAIVDGLKSDGLLKGPPFSNRIDFLYFDFWHYDGRTSKHGAFMGGADFVQWHGNYPMLSKMVELKALAQDLRSGRPHAK